MRTAPVYYSITSSPRGSTAAALRLGGLWIDSRLDRGFHRACSAICSRINALPGNFNPMLRWEARDGNGNHPSTALKSKMAYLLNNEFRPRGVVGHGDEFPSVETISSRVGDKHTARSIRLLRNAAITNRHQHPFSLENGKSDR